MEILPLLRLNRFKVFLLSRAGVSISPDTVISSTFKVVGCGRVKVGGPSFIGHRVTFYTSSADISVGRGVDIGPEVSIITGGHEIGNETRRAGKGSNEPVTISDGCWIGARVLILGGVTIGAGTVVAAGAVVTDNLDGGSLYAGVPARKVKSLDGNY
ncbi:acetyltransferase (isoleucine patch superfamily)-like protein [Isoalcanivorax pacificus W11-5]|uniref:Acetyltransferase (Isoleucine patch superfamily)-like protein n=2 Tax=Isoalcanivorax TaxID=3020833 RepID=A0A0B4XQK9_9GAMM|nr:acetyltransferase (isoleucine patch superfamily)-like protein [Isoalcanivorax pacificus W11-5]